MDGVSNCVECGRPHGRHVEYGEGYGCWCAECRPAAISHNEAVTARYRRPSEDILQKYIDGYYLEPGQMYTAEQEKEIKGLIESYFDAQKSSLIKRR